MLKVRSPPTGIIDPCGSSRMIQAVLFDLDGTLYFQRPLRRKMAAELGVW